MPAYVIYQGEVVDRERYDEYRAEAAASIANAGGRYVVRGGDIDVLEGDAPASRTVVLEFADMSAARAWYDGPEYTHARTIREGAARGVRMYVVDGYDDHAVRGRDDDIVELTVVSPGEADLVVGRLRAAGIDASFVAGGTAASIPSMDFAEGSRVLVHRAELADAQRVLAESAQPVSDAELSAQAERAHAPDDPDTGAVV